LISNILSFLKRQSKNLYVILVRSFFLEFFRGFNEYKNLYVYSLGASIVQLGSIKGITQIIQSLSAGTIGLAIDKYSVKRILTYIMLLEIMTPILYVLAQNWIMVIPAIIIDIFTRHTIMILHNVILAKNLTGDERATGLGMILTLSTLPRIFSPIIAAYLIDVFGGLNTRGIRPLFYIQFVAFIPLAIWVYRNIEETKKISGNEISLGKDFFSIFKGEKGPILFLIISSFDIFAFNLIMPFLTIYAVEIKGANSYIIGSMVAIHSIVTILFSTIIGRLSDKIGRKKILYLQFIPFVGWMISYILAPSPFYLLVAAFFHGFVIAATPSSWRAITLEIVPEEQRGRYYGTRIMVANLVSIPAPLLGGLIWDKINPSLIFYVAIAFELVSMVLTIFIPETLKK
jgi:MFS family permease